MEPQLSHLRHMPFRTIMNCLHSAQGSPSYPFWRASCTSVIVTVSRCISTVRETFPLSPFFPVPFPDERREGKISGLIEVEPSERGSTKSSPSSSSSVWLFFERIDTKVFWGDLFQVLPFEVGDGHFPENIIND